MTEALLKAARAYVKRGISVLPVNPLGHDKPKQPNFSLLPRSESGEATWDEYKSRLPTDAELIRWYGNGSKARLAIIGGSVSRGLVFLDVDDLDLAERIRADEDFLDGMVVSSTPSGGLHLYFRVRGRVGTRPYPSAENTMGEIRSYGAYVVAPPSAGYKWERSGPIPVIDDWPTWFRGFCERFGITETGKARGGLVRRSARLPDVISEGRHNLLMREATRLHYKGLDEQEILETIRKIDSERCKPPLGLKELKRLSRWAGELPEKKQYELSDDGNCDRLVERYGENLRYTPGRGWFIWNGKRWLNDQLGQVYELAKDTIAGIADESDNDSVQKWARISQSGSHLREMIARASHDSAIAVLAEVFDSDPWLLNVANGTLDLRTGKLREPRREDYITKQIRIEYHDAEGPTFQRFIRKILPDPQTRGFVQRLFGYSITGDVSEQVFPIFYGEGSNGKSTLNTCIMDVMGDYATQAAPGMFIQSRTDGGNEKAVALGDLQGVRIIFSFETDENRRLSEGLVKQATGGDRVKARQLYKGYFEFAPSHHIFLVTNHLPRVTGMDTGIWRRIRRVPFNVTISEDERDRDLPRKLKEEYPYILKWLVAGCVAWQRYGLGEPEEVIEATEDYRGESDIVGRFVEDACSRDSTKSVRAGVLFDQFKVWAEKQGERSYMTQIAFGRRLTALNFTKGRDNTGQRTWIGITLRRISAR